VVATGPPEKIATVEESYTGQFLKQLLDKQLLDKQLPEKKLLEV